MTFDENLLTKSLYLQKYITCILKCFGAYKNEIKTFIF